jgi:hypothetical protein
LVANCGFETGDFTSWTLSGKDVTAGLLNIQYGVELGTDPDGNDPNSGSYQAWFADTTADTMTLSQVLSTKAGDTYQISFYLAQDTALVSPYHNAFSAAFGTDTLASLTAIPVQGYTMYTLTAATGSTDLSFELGNDLGEFLLDDVQVTDVTTPEPATLLLLLSAGAVSGLAKKLRRRSS